MLERGEAFSLSVDDTSHDWQLMDAAESQQQ